ncbi:MAG: DUF433 domain-containing protein [Chloroflexi bacterium]|nr:DUF433 domain-containing protein [Chloroflexota bacterium]MDL1882177.1 DUF433 domain-containing protein [Anaerolineae bacterium CFX8]
MKYERITIDPGVMVGKPVIKGTRITVESIVEKVKGGMSTEEIMGAHPRLTPEDTYVALEYAENADRTHGLSE